jgi:hypothetical protein
MGYLIEVDASWLARGIPFAATTEELRDAWTKLAQVFLGQQEFQRPSGVSLGTVRNSFPRVPLDAQSSTKRPIHVTNDGSWDLSEVHRQLCQVGVLIEALMLLAKRYPGGVVTSLSPTQQPGFDARGSDGTGSEWILEVFGGANVTNNRKVHKDAEKLRKEAVQYRYWACFEDAWGNRKPSTYSFMEVARSDAPPAIILWSV